MIAGVKARHPPIPYNTPWDRAKCVTFVAYELAASDKHIITIPIVDSQHCIRGHANIRPMTKGVRKYARPCSWLENTESHGLHVY